MASMDPVFRPAASSREMAGWREKLLLQTALGSSTLGIAVAMPLTQLKPPLEPQKRPLTFLHEYPQEKEYPGQLPRPRPHPPGSGLQS